MAGDDVWVCADLEFICSSFSLYPVETAFLDKRFLTAALQGAVQTCGSDRYERFNQCLFLENAAVVYCCVVSETWSWGTPSCGWKNCQRGCIWGHLSFLISHLTCSAFQPVLPVLYKGKESFGASLYLSNVHGLKVKSLQMLADKISQLYSYLVVR